MTRELQAAASTQFGSGWAWLVLADAKQNVVKTSNDGTRPTERVRPWLAIGVREHAYYLDLQNRRADDVHAVLDKLMKWAYAAEDLGSR